MAFRQRFESHDAASAFILSAMATVVMSCGLLAPYDSGREAAEESDNEWASSADRGRRRGVDDDEIISKEVEVNDDEWGAQAVVAACGCGRPWQRRLVGLEDVLSHGSIARSSNWQWSSLRHAR